MKSGTLPVNDAQIYNEVRGNGPPVLLISGMTGDAGHYSKIADILADEFTVVTYDRRGNSRSLPPQGWTRTSIAEQADDAALLIKKLGLSPAAVFGNSGGAIILLDMVDRHPEVLRGAIVHEPPIVSMLPNAREIMGPFQTMLEQAMAKGGPQSAMELFVRAAAGNSVFERLEPKLRERMLGNAKIGLAMEMEPFVSYKPNIERLKTTNMPLIVAEGVETRNIPQNLYLHQCCEWLAQQLETTVEQLPGAHAGYQDQPEEFANALRPLLRKPELKAIPNVA